MKVAVIGAGTAGLATAIALAADGHDVTVYEQRTALDGLGAGLLIQPQGVAVLDALGVGSAFRAESLPIERLYGHSHRGWEIVDMNYRAGQEARAVSRENLTRVLLAGARAQGARVHLGSRIREVGVAGARGVVVLEEDAHEHDLVVIASGAASDLVAAGPLAARRFAYRWGALWALCEVEAWSAERYLLQRYRGTEEMVGLLPTSRTADGKLCLSVFWSLPVDRYPGWHADTPLHAWKAQVTRLWPEADAVLATIQSKDQLKFAQYWHARPRTLAAPPLCVAGDAAHAMSPQLGMGSTLALEDALCLRDALRIRALADGLTQYSRQRLWRARMVQGLSQLMTPCFQRSGSGLWRDVLFGASCLMPYASTVMRWTISRGVRSR